jgi:hypothetical protein
MKSEAKLRTELRAVRVAQVEECLLARIKPWVQTPVPLKKKKKKKEEEEEKEEKKIREQNR